MKPRVSIIIPNYNSGAFLKEALASALYQTYDNLQIIVVDDGSTDESWQAAQDVPGVKLIRKKNEGAPAARNVGLENADGDYIKFFDADDVLMPNAIAQQVSHQVTLPADGVTYGDLAWFGLKNRGFGNKSVRPGHCSDIVRNNILTSTPLLKRASVVDIGGFDPSIRRSQEWDLHVRLAAAGARFFYKPIPVYLYRKHAEIDRISVNNARELQRKRLNTISRTYDSVRDRIDHETAMAFVDKAISIARLRSTSVNSELWKAIFDFVRSVSGEQSKVDGAPNGWKYLPARAEWRTKAYKCTQLLTSYRKPK